MCSPSRFKTPTTGTNTDGGLGWVGPTCNKGGIVEQYSIGLFGFGLFTDKLLTATFVPY